MNLILWRHADAEDGAPGRPDDARRLTARGEKQAKRMAAWLKGQLPERAQVLVSPARRAQQTAQALTKKFDTARNVVPGPVVDERADAQVGIIAYGTSHWAIAESRDQLVQEADLHTSYLRLRAYPFSTALGEFIALRNHQQALRVGIATWIGLLAGMLAKFVLAFMMVGIFLVALLV